MHWQPKEEHGDRLQSFYKKAFYILKTTSPINVITNEKECTPKDGVLRTGTIFVLYEGESGAATSR
ncbi:hypothetical protein DDT54_02800 [Brenneria nigrifluens DSM 30175 = ATCC 13028]|uniref:Uncharacterized protein n=1 Tax=Brenneria nigrifluens DSM 30175 = ATCC 13028 TaxID=1121120 RepID=A0A2U1UVM3_9GAMM|nr:hypothetical protein DDT54_02800 [Brenneria nigrifluens DSM 30175 = ATCC 13028]